MEKKLSVTSKTASTEANSVQSYIRLFEAIVIRSLKTYTVTASVDVQVILMIQTLPDMLLCISDIIYIFFIITQQTCLCILIKCILLTCQLITMFVEFAI